MDSFESLNKRWWKEDTVAVVTGANKGIGYAIVHQLAEHGICVILTARDEERGMAATKTLNEQGFHNVVFHQLDVHDENSIHTLANWVKQKYGKLDILEDTVAVVTGANKGIGYAIVHQLAEHGICVVLTARDEERGMAATKTLNEQGFHNVVFHQLDVHDENSIHVFANWVKEKYGKLDILVNNAAILGLAIDYDILKANQTTPAKIFSGSPVEGVSASYEKAKECIDINYYGAKRMVEAFLPLLKVASKGGGRIVNVSSSAGVLENIPSEALRQQLNNINDLTEERIDAFLHNFLKDCQQGLSRSNGWAIRDPSVYIVSKAALNAYTRLLALQHSDLYVNCVHPGFVKTDMTFNAGRISIDEGAKGPVTVALHPIGSPSGQYYDKLEIASFDMLPKQNLLFGNT